MRPIFSSFSSNFPSIFLACNFVTFHLRFLLFSIIFIKNFNKFHFSFANALANFHSHLLITSDPHHYVFVPNIQLGIRVPWPWSLFLFIYIVNQPRVVRITIHHEATTITSITHQEAIASITKIHKILRGNPCRIKPHILLLLMIQFIT